MENKQLNANEIQKAFQGPDNLLQIEIHDEVTSTNDVIKPLFQKYPNHISLVATNKQTAGRGRGGKHFYSGLRDGLYFSLAFRPNDKKLENVPLYTILTAATLGKTLEKYLDEPIAIKWVNDIFYKRKKVVGILSEMIWSVESDGDLGIVIGIGINFAGNFSASDETVQTVAGTLFGEEVPADFSQSQFLGEYLTQFLIYHKAFQEKSFMAYYDQLLLGKGENVYYTVNGERKNGVIEGINEMGHLLVKQENGTVEELYGQEVHFGSKQFIDKLK